MKKRIITIAIIIGLLIGCSGIESYCGMNKIAYSDTLKKTMRNKGYRRIDSVKEIDRYSKNKWYAYYVNCDGDCYVVTIKNGRTQKCIQLN